ncbi:MAG: AlkZ family DNA glycosylase [Myxococcales bacterium]|nr:AlkZ family DNA glycosylase [Myxococcales bacterium]
MQGQDYPSAVWAVALRTERATWADVEHAFASAAIVRTWPMRGTLHVVPAEDARWMCRLTGELALPKMARRRAQLGLDEETLSKAARIFEETLAPGAPRTRAEMLDALERGGVSPAGQRGYHLLAHWSIRGLLCFGPARDKEQTFVLLDAWVPRSRDLEGDEALFELATRYLASHAPATHRDFAWWAGIGLTRAKRAFEMVRIEAQPASRRALPALLLPGFDEYLLGYADRSAVLDAAYVQAICPGNNGVFQPTLVIDGRIVGTWRRSVGATRARLRLSPFEALGARARSALEKEAERYGRFLGVPVAIEAD